MEELSIAGGGDDNMLGDPDGKSVGRPKWTSRNKYLTGGGWGRTAGSSKNLLKSTQQKGTGGSKKSTYTCEPCGKSYGSSYSLKVHLRSHTGEKPFQCQECEKSFGTNFLLERHMFCHNKLSNCVCEYCAKRFATKDSLTIHLRSHTGQQPFSCDKCDKRYPSRSSLTRHLSTHDDQPNYLCDECGKKFTSSGTLRVHLQSHVRERKFPCGRCRLRFKRQMDLQRHVKTHLEQTRLPCPYTGCKHRFRRKDNLLRHLRLTHDQSNQEAFDSYNFLTGKNTCRPRVKLKRNPPNTAILNGEEDAMQLKKRFEESIESMNTHVGNNNCTPSNDKDFSIGVTTEEPAAGISKLPNMLIEDSHNSLNDADASQLRIAPLTNQRSVIRSVESLDIRRHVDHSLVSAPDENFVSPHITRSSSEEHSPECDNMNDQFQYQSDQQSYYSSTVHQPEDNSAQNNEIVHPECSSTHANSETPAGISQNCYTDFRYGTLFPFKPHIQPETFNYNQHLAQVYSKQYEYDSVEASQEEVSQPLIRGTSTLLDLSSSSNPYPHSQIASASSNNVPVVNTLDLAPVPYQHEELVPENAWETKRPQNFSVIRRAFPVYIRSSESQNLPSTGEDSNMAYNLNHDLTQAADIIISSSDSELGRNSLDLIQVQSEPSSGTSEQLNDPQENRQSLVVNQHAIRDPRKNFLWENFNRHYKPY